MTLDEAAQLSIRRLSPLVEIGESAATMINAVKAYAMRNAQLEEILKKNNIEIPK